MAANEVRITLTVDGDTVKIQEATRDVERLGEAGKSAHDGARESADNYAAALVKKLGIYAALTAAVYKLGSGVVSAFRDGIMAVDDFNKTVISVASTMADMAGDKNNVGAIYAHNLAYAKDMFRELELAAGRHFASGKDLQIAWNVLTQKGVTLRKEDVDSLGVIVDKVKLLTQGQMSSVQIATELRAMYDGQARANSQLAMLLKDQLGPGWDDLIKKHAKAGDLIEWMAGLFPGLIAAQKEIESTLESQAETLSTHLTTVGREGLGGAYEWIVEQLKEANSWLKEHGAQLSKDIRQAWEDIKPLVVGIKDTIWSMVQAAGYLAQKLSQVMGALTRHEGLNEAVAGAMTGDLEAAAHGMERFNEQVKILQKTRATDYGEDPLAGVVSGGIGGKGGAGGEGGGGGKGGGGKSSINKELAWLKKEAQEATKDANEILRLYDKTHANTRKLLGQQAKISERWEISSKDVLGGGRRAWKPLEKVYKPDKDEGLKDFAKDAGKDLGKAAIGAIKDGRDVFAAMGEVMLNKFADLGGDILGKLFDKVFVDTGSVLIKSFIDGGNILMEAGEGIMDFISKGADFLMGAGEGIMNMLGSIFGGGGGAGGIISGVIGAVTSIFGFHQGGPADWRRAHSGLGPILPGEMPAILQRDEFVLTGSDVRRLGGPGRVDAMRRGEAGRGGQPVIVNIYPRHQMTRGEWERAVRLYVAPALAEAQRFRGGR